MGWQFRIYTALNLEEQSPRIISDSTGVLFSPAFLSFLDGKKVPYTLCRDLPTLTTAFENKDRLIITSLLPVPSFLTKKADYHKFSLKDLPLLGSENASLLASQSPEALVQLLNYVFATDSHKVITKHNVTQLQAKAAAFASKSEATELMENIRLLLSEAPSYQLLSQLAKQWGKLVYLSAKHKQHDFLELIPQIDAFAEQFVTSGKINEVYIASTPKNPISVNRILPNIKSENPEKIALLCFDCMGWAEWFLLKDFLRELKLSSQEREVFAMLPSITSISRTAIFHGSADIYTVRYPGQKDEEKSFTTFFSERETRYFTEKDTIDDDALIGYDCISILYSFFDELCHSAKFPKDFQSKELYFKTVNDYLSKSPLKQHLKTLLENGFAIFFCSDHGSVVATGNGKKVEKYIIDKYAKRACIIPSSSGDLTQFRKVKIPFNDDRMMVLPEGRSMFASKKSIEITHGGISIEEMVVPYIKFIA